LLRPIWIVILTLLSLALPLTGCGKKGSPERPPGADFPRQYPNPNPPAT
jgi:predicted small lipoprotein YifL